MLMGARRPGYDLLRDYYTAGPIKLDEKAFRRALHDGVIPGSASKPAQAPPVNTSALASLAPTPAGDTEVKFALCPKVVDGRFSNNGWLRELPHPITKVTWDNVIEMSPQMAQRMKISSGNVLQIAVGDAKVSGPAWVQPGQPDGSVTVTLGYGRTGRGAVATTTDADATVTTCSATNDNRDGQPRRRDYHELGGDYRFANVQMHDAMQGEHRALRPYHGLQETSRVESSFQPRTSTPGRITRCARTTCFPGGRAVGDDDLPQPLCRVNARRTACQAEHNIPVVGKDHVACGREMHWIRVDRYYGPNERRDEDETASDLTNPTVVYQPAMCLHCEKAPCEPVCPVAATVHSHDGLNQMVTTGASVRDTAPTTALTRSAGSTSSTTPTTRPSSPSRRRSRSCGF